MSELIDRQALKNKLKRWDECDPYEFVEMAFYAVDDAPAINAAAADDCIREEMDKVPTASPWHRVEEELPEIGKLVLLYYGGGYSIAARTEDEMWERKRYWKLDDGYWERIEDDYYWMPIEPPKEEEHGN